MRAGRCDQASLMGAVNASPEQPFTVEAAGDNKVFKEERGCFILHFWKAVLVVVWGAERERESCLGELAGRLRLLPPSGRDTMAP